MKPIVCRCCDRIFQSPEDVLKGTSRFRQSANGFLWFECSCGSGLILKKGEFEWYSPSLHMSPAVATIFKEVQEIKTIPLIPTAILTLQNVISHENSTAMDITKALKDTPNIAMGVLRTANNLKLASIPAFNSVGHAVTYVGRKTLCDLILAETLQEFDFKTHHFSKDVYWQEAILTGRIAEHLAGRFTKNVAKDEAYIAGSLCNIGKVVAAICFPSIADEVSKIVVNARRPKTWVEGEDDMRAISHVVLGELAAALWGFPEYVTHAIANHHMDPKKVPELTNIDLEFLDDIHPPGEVVEPNLQQIVALANQFSHWILLQPSRMNEQIFTRYAQIFCLDDKKCSALADTLMQFKIQVAA